ncbi:MAG: hypothetical protein ACE5FN_04780 [Leptospirillia bacterium]
MKPEEVQNTEEGESQPPGGRSVCERPTWLYFLEVIFLAIGTVAAIVAAFSAFATLDQTASIARDEGEARRLEAEASRLHERLTVLPKVEVVLDRFPIGTGFFVRNSGVGPADVKTFEVMVAGEYVDSWPAFSRAIGFEDNKAVHWYIPTPGVMIPAGARNNLYVIGPEIAGQDLTQQVERVIKIKQEHLLKKVNDIQIQICYCSLYKECWVASNSDSSHMRRVDECWKSPIRFKDVARVSY